MARHAAALERGERPWSVGSGWWLVHGLPLLAPGIGCGIWAVLVELAHRAWGGSPIVTPIMAVVFLLVGGLITAYGWLTAGKREALRIAVTASGVAASLTLVLGLIFGLIGVMWLLSVYAICSAVVWLLWGIWRASKYAGHSAHGDHTGTNALVEAARSAGVRFHGAKMDARGVLRAKVSTTPGGTLEDAQALVGPLSAETRAVPGGASLIRHPDRDGLGEIEIATRDNLSRPIPWPGLAELGTLGQLPTVRFSVGERQSGLCEVQIVGDYRQSRSAPDISHVKIGGVTGSGKSTGAQTFLGSMMGMRKLTIVGVDVATQMQILGPLAEGLSGLVSAMDLARLFIRRMNAVVIPGRKAQLAREGLKRWTPDSELNLMLVWVEESKAFGALSTAYHHMVADARAAGVWIVSSTQNWLYRTLSTDVRKQHTSGICYGMSEPDDVSNVLPEEAVAALGKGRLPTWADRKPGYCYIAGLGVAEKDWPRMVRTYDPLPDQLREAVRLGAPYRDPVDEVTRELLGELYGDIFADRSRLPAADQPRRPSTTLSGIVTKSAHQFESNAPDDDIDEMAGEDAESMTTEEYEQDREEMFGELNEARRRYLGDDGQAADYADVDPDQPIESPAGELEDDEEESDTGQRPSPEQAQAIWDGKLDALWRSGGRHLTTAHLTGWLAEVGRARPFLYRQRDRWQAAGLIEARPDANGWDLIGSPLESSGPPSPPHGE